jgi:hypothetical protein
MKHFAFFSLVLFFFVQLLLSSCGEDDLKKAGALGSNQLKDSVDTTIGVDLIYSDSAKVKAKGFAPVLNKVTPKKGGQYQEMPKGVKIEFFDDFLKRTGTITSDYAIMKEAEKLTIFKRNVVVVNDQMTFNTEELTWDENKKMFFSPQGVVTNPNGDVLNAVNFRAPQDFSTFYMENGSAEGYVDDNFGQ